ncbi:MAG: hypothetical protein D6741_01050 [Planctomycetota bacterium]|nr:MAG: hypothetical protein D6741_01050 [Planctomycetota bacterium]
MSLADVNFIAIFSGDGGTALIAFALMVAGVLWHRSRHVRRVDPVAWIAVAAGWIAITGILTRHAWGLALIVPALVLISVSAVEYAGSRLRATVTTLATALEHRIPVATALEGLYREGVLGKKALKALTALQAGTGLSSAFETARLGSADFRFALAVGERFGDVSSVLHAWLGAERSRKHVVTAWIERGLYLVWLSITVTAATGGFANYFSLTSIVSQVGGTTWLNAELSDLLFPWIGGLPLIALAFFPLTAFSWTKLYGFWKWSPVQHRERATILLTLWAAVRSGNAIVGALEMLARKGKTAATRQRAEDAMRRIYEGQNWIDAMGRSRLLAAADVRALRTVLDNRSLTVVLERLIDGHVNQDAAKVEAKMAIAFPLIVCICAVPVGVTGVYLVASLADLIRLLAG